MADYRGKKEMPITWRRNSPGGLKKSAIQWDGQVGKDGAFLIFKSMEYGTRALMHTILTNYVIKKKPLAKWMREYAPPSANNTKAYTSFLATYAGIPANTNVALTKEQFKKMVNAFSYKEGGKTLPDDIYNGAFDLVTNPGKKLLK